MRVYRNICPQHAALLFQRSQAEHTRIIRSLRTGAACALTVGLYQMRNCCAGQRGKDSNLARMVSAIRFMARHGVQMLVFPEMSLPGYFTNVDGTPEEARAANHLLADDIQTSLHLAGLRRVAKECKIVLAFGFAEKAGRRCYNSIGVVDADGRWLGVRRKNPLYPWPYETGSFDEPARARRSSVFRTRYATVGISNCFDGEFPETIRRMRLEGAELLLWCNAACGDSKLGTSHRIHHSGGHAQANGLWVVCCNCVAQNASGTSCIIAPSGEPLVILPPAEEALGAHAINLALSRNWDLWRKRI